LYIAVFCSWQTSLPAYAKLVIYYESFGFYESAVAFSNSNVCKMKAAANAILRFSASVANRVLCGFR
jgi:hypothetical protein